VTRRTDNEEGTAQVTQDALEIARHMSEVFNELSEEAAFRYVAEDFVDHEAPPGTPGGPEGYLATAKFMNECFADARWEPIATISQGDKAVIHVRFTGRHVKDFLGVKPTGAQVNIEHMHIYRVKDGRVVEHWGCRQDLFLMLQLGMVELDIRPFVPSDQFEKMKEETGA
jgi:predicted ester cyclase